VTNSYQLKIWSRI